MKKKDMFAEFKFIFKKHGKLLLWSEYGAAFLLAIKEAFFCEGRQQSLLCDDLTITSNISDKNDINYRHLLGVGSVLNNYTLRMKSQVNIESEHVFDFILSLEKEQISFSGNIKAHVLQKLLIHQKIVQSSFCILKTSPGNDSSVVKSSMHLERQKLGKSPEEKELIFSQQSRPRQQIEVIGLDLQPSHNIALHALCKIFAKRNYKGGHGAFLVKSSNSFMFDGVTPRIMFSRAEFLDAYGVRRYKSSRGKLENCGKSVKEALEALKYLSEKPHLIVACRKRFDKGDLVFDRYQSVSTVIKMCEGWEGLSYNENARFVGGVPPDGLEKKHAGFVVELCPLFIDQIESYFVLKPANIYQEIKLRHPSSSKFVYMFVDWIVQEATLKKRKFNIWPERLEIGLEALSYKLRMDSYITSRNWKRIDCSINKCAETAKNLGWIDSYYREQGKTISEKLIFVLNKSRFNKLSAEKELVKT